MSNDLVTRNRIITFGSPHCLNIAYVKDVLSTENSSENYLHEYVYTLQHQSKRTAHRAHKTVELWVN